MKDCLSAIVLAIDTFLTGKNISIYQQQVNFERGFNTVIDLIMKNKKRLYTVKRGDFCLTSFQPNINKLVLKHQVAKCHLTSQNYLTFCIFFNKQHNAYLHNILYLLSTLWRSFKLFLFFKSAALLLHKYLIISSI